MNREEFINELEYLLQDIPEEEKTDALDYYRDYLEEAGDRADEAIQEFGSPERIAAIIRSDINGHLENGGEFTERGYEDERFRDPNYQVAKRYDLPEVSEPAGFGEKSGKPEERWREDGRRKNAASNTVVKVILWIILICVTSPLWLGIGGGLLGLIAGIGGGLLGILVAAAVITVVFFVVGIVVIVAGMVHIAASPLGGLLAAGVGLLMIGIALLCLLASVQFYGRFIPWAFRGIINSISRFAHRKEEIR